ncbi:MAG: polysaccharide pyruvyl transferase family protein [Coleofasciculus sp. B1-GNL1-01]|uniref:polysaccharide pyruvyl transferase family protein n=1 Tax=Coleofasciculus sp. B1-GNL1-01 TaxID=3068484 RepID=UPI003301C5EC
MIDHQQSSLDLSSSEKIKKVLQETLATIEPFEQCALLDYPDYLNIGDHLIWLGTVFYLKKILKTQIKYTATVKNFSETEMLQKIGDAPILFQGGGNLGDLWPELQEFRERVIAKHHSQPIIILPQTIYFEDQNKLNQAAEIFNAHPNLTIFARENYSYETACHYFSNCKVLKAPDMAFNLVNMPGLSFSVSQDNSILYHCRRDCRNFAQELTELNNLVVEDWVSYQWLQRDSLKNPEAWYWKIPGLVRLIREGWQRGLTSPGEWISRQRWHTNHPYIDKLSSIDEPSLFYKSWDLMHSGIYQLKQYPWLITNRMHGHILSILLGIPHLFLPGTYHKNKSFYTTWTYQLPFCQFFEDNSQAKAYIYQRLNKQN